MSNIGLEIRKEYLGYSLLLESTTSILLAGLLGVKQPLTSKTFGNKNSSLSFNTKIDLLIDIGALDTGCKNKYQKFMEIRNQFMHNIAASTCLKCLNHIDGSINFFKNNYSKEFGNGTENQAKKAAIALAIDVLDLTGQLVKKLEEKIRKDVEYDMLKKSLPILLKSLSKSHIKK
jgi:hypothetical protein